MGSIYNQMGRFDDALRSLDRSATFEPNSWQCAYETAKAWLGKHDYDHAIRQLDRAQALGGTQIAGPMHILRGYALLGEKRMQEASVELQAYLATNPNGPMASSVRADLAKIKTLAVQNQSSIALPAMSLFSGDPQ